MIELPSGDEKKFDGKFSRFNAMHRRAHDSKDRAIIAVQHAVQQYLFAITGWILEGRQPIKAGSKKKYKINTMYNIKCQKYRTQEQCIYT